MNLQELLGYWLVIKKRLWLIAILVGATVGSILLVAYLSKPQYQADSSFQVTSPLPSDVTLVSEFRSVTSRDELPYTRNNFLAVLQSEWVVGQVIDRLALDTTVEDLLAKAVIEADASSDFIHLSITADDPRLAAAIANTWVELAAQYFGELSAGSLTANKTFIQQELAQTNEDLDIARQALVTFQMENSIGLVERFLSSQQDLITSAKASRDSALARGETALAAGYDRIIVDRERELQARIQISAEYGVLKDNFERVSGMHAVLLDKETEADLKINEIQSARYIRVIPAREPSRPLPNLDPRILLVGILASIVVGVVLAFLLEFLERRAAPTRPTTPALSENGRRDERSEALA